MKTLKKVKSGVREEVQRIRQEARERALGYITGAFGVIAGLAWNDFVKALIENVFPSEENGTIWAKLVYAAVMTLVVVGVTVYLSRILREGSGKESTGSGVAK
ncbi:MAG: DUF5654 family protein [Nanoarchaeota archaeon]|nr:DUF5654 family protein [Nanoarchaeota archaeon]